MNSAVVTLIVVGVVVIIAVVAWLLYKANFKAKEIKIKTGVADFTLDRKPGTETPNTAPAAPRTEATQEAIDRGRIEGASIKAPAESGARLSQKAEGESSITNSTIELK